MFSFKCKRRGFTLVELLVVIVIVGMLIGMLMPAVQSVRESSRKTTCSANIKQLGLAVQLYANARRQLPTSSRPPGVATGPRFSWATLVLPYLEKQDMYDEYNCQKNWSDASPPSYPRQLSNAELVAIRIPAFECPSTPEIGMRDGDIQYWTSGYSTWNDSRCAALTSYAPIVQVESRLYTDVLQMTPPPDATGMLPRNMPATPDHVADGFSNTILLAESAGRPYVYRRGRRLGDLDTNRVNGGGWCRPASDFGLDGSSRDGVVFPGPCAINCTNGEDYVQGGDDKSAVPIPYYGTYSTGETFSFHSGGANVVFGDGSVHFLDEAIDIKLYGQLVTRRAHEIIRESFE